MTIGGHSRVVDPSGEVVVEAGQEEGFTCTEIDPELPRKVRDEFPALADRRWPASAEETTRTTKEFA